MNFFGKCIAKMRFIDYNKIQRFNEKEDNLYKSEIFIHYLCKMSFCIFLMKKH